MLALKIQTRFLLFCILFLCNNTATADGVIDSVQEFFTREKTNSDYKQAHSLYRAGDYSGALTLYKKLVTNEPDFAELNFNVGLCYIHLKEYSNATPYLEKAAALADSKNSRTYFRVNYDLFLTQTYNTLAAAYYYQNKPEAALSNYE